MKLLTLFLFLFSSSVIAADTPTVDWSFGEFFTSVSNFFIAVEYFIFEAIPQMIDDLKIYMTFWVIKIYIQMKMSSVEMSFAVAELLLSHFGFSSLFDSALSSLPADTKALISQYGLIRAINIIIEAYIARFILNLGWF